MRDLADVRLFPVRAGAWLIGAFGALALVVAAVGLYGVIGYSVSRRVREIGIRKALGARPGQLVGMVLGEGMIARGDWRRDRRGAGGCGWRACCRACSSWVPFDLGELRDGVRRAGVRRASRERGAGAASGAGRSDGRAAIELGNIECTYGRLSVVSQSSGKKSPV